MALARPGRLDWAFTPLASDAGVWATIGDFDSTLEAAYKLMRPWFESAAPSVNRVAVGSTSVLSGARDAATCLAGLSADIPIPLSQSLHEIAVRLNSRLHLDEFGDINRIVTWNMREFLELDVAISEQGTDEHRRDLGHAAHFELDINTVPGEMMALSGGPLALLFDNLVDEARVINRERYGRITA